MAKKKKAKKVVAEPTATVDPKVAELMEENAELKAKAEAKTGIKNVKSRTIDGEQPRPDALMKRHLRTSKGKKIAAMSEAEKVSVERELRKHVKKGGTRRDVDNKMVKVPGGFRKGISDDRIAYAKILLVRMGRDPENPTWDESIQVPGMSNVLKGQSHKL